MNDCDGNEVGFISVAPIWRRVVSSFTILLRSLQNKFIVGIITKLKEEAQQ
jgi:hypothetical protein